MFKIIAASVLSLGLAGPALAYGVSVVPFDPAAELARATGSAQFPTPAPTSMFEQQARTTNGGSQQMPHVVGSIPHNGIAMVEGGSSRSPVLNQDVLSHPPTAVAQDQVIVHEFEDPAPLLADDGLPADYEG